MNYHQYYPTDVLNGEGIRCVLFVSGCIHACPGCYNESTWDPINGEPYTKDLEDQIIADLKDERIPRQGLTLSGGDPLHKRNLESVLQLIRRVRFECPSKDIWLWTGYTLEEINERATKSDRDWLRHMVSHEVDVLVDGKFVKALHHPGLKWRGSSNQKVYRMNGYEEPTDITPNDQRII